MLGQTLLIGHTTRGTANKYEALKSWTEISESNLITLSDGSRMSQYVFGRELAQQINEHCADKTTIVSRLDPNQQLPPINPEYTKQRLV